MRRSPLRSPPRMRGKGLCKGFHLCDVGITPAYAGKRHCPRSRPGRIRDHPRVCGEKGRLPHLGLYRLGSPPRVRGKDVYTVLKINPSGITPAYAGKSPLPPCRPVSPARFSGSGRHGPTLHPGHGGARRQAGPPGPAPPPQMRSGWSPPPCTGRQCRTRKSTHARRARIPAPAHTPAPQ